MKAWPRIKLVDNRGHTVTMFERMPEPPPRTTARGATREVNLNVVAVVEHKDTAGRRRAADLLATEWAPKYIEGHWPTAQAAAEAAVNILETNGFSIEPEQSILDLIETRLSKGLGLGENWDVREYGDLSCHELQETVEHATREGKTEPELTFKVTSTTAHFAGKPRGASRWEAVPRPPSKKARAHRRRALEQDGYIIPGVNGAPPPADPVIFDGQQLVLVACGKPELPWTDVERVLDQVATDSARHNGHRRFPWWVRHREALTLTIDQLRNLVVQRSC